MVCHGATWHIWDVQANSITVVYSISRSSPQPPNSQSQSAPNVSCVSIVYRLCCKDKREISQDDRKGGHCKVIDRFLGHFTKVHRHSSVATHTEIAGLVERFPPPSTTCNSMERRSYKLCIPNRHQFERSSIKWRIDDSSKSSSRYNTIDINDVIVDSCNLLMSGNAMHKWMCEAHVICNDLHKLWQLDARYMHDIVYTMHTYKAMTERNSAKFLQAECISGS
jgi:hypothetical protein